jgi:hypothetical protein
MTFTAHIGGQPFDLPRSAYVTDAPLTLEMAQTFIPFGAEIYWQNTRCWFGRAPWLSNRPLVIPLRDA